METTLILILQILQMLMLSGRGYLLFQWKKITRFFLSAPARQAALFCRGQSREAAGRKTSLRCRIKNRKSIIFNRTKEGAVCGMIFRPTRMPA